MNGKTVRSPAPLISDDLPESEVNQLREFLLRRRCLDLSMYKDPCIRRRIAKRMRSLGLTDLPRYIELLRCNPEEADQLLNSLTIHVSQFFRNPSTYATLERSILPGLVAAVQEAGRREIRVWSIGCAEGEEPYSLALLFDRLPVSGLRVSILGTDLSRETLNRAREGLFHPMRLTEMPAETRNRYFLPEGDYFRLERKIRGMVQFSEHNILSAGDYPTADLIFCRNVLIYFSRTDQERILCRLAESLNENGILVLGKAETLLGAARELFDVEVLTEKIYRRS